MYLYNFDPLKPNFYIVKLGFPGVYIIFLISAQNIDCGYSLEPPRRGGSNEYHNLCFEQKYEKYQNFYLKTFRFLVVKFSRYLNRRMNAYQHEHISTGIQKMFTKDFLEYSNAFRLTYAYNYMQIYFHLSKADGARIVSK